jgi:hypothetical protein
MTGHYASARMGIEIVLKPRNAAGLTRELHAAYTRHSGGYHHGPGHGRFDARYAYRPRPSRPGGASQSSTGPSGTIRDGFRFGWVM